MGHHCNLRFTGPSAALICALLLVSGCSGTSADLSSIAGPQPAPSLEQQISDLPTPEGADPVTFAQLKSALAAAFTRGTVKRVSAPPSKPHTAVDDFDADLQNNVVFTWTYSNPGDYNKDGEVNISDLTPLGKYLGATDNSPDWDKARTADGNGDGEVNISDLSPLGSGLGSAVEGYLLRYSAVPSNPDAWEVLETALMGNSEVDPTTSELRFTVAVTLADLPNRDVYFQVVPFQGSALGIGSNSDTIIPLPPQISEITPISGDSNAVARFTAEVFGEPPLDYEWNFGGGAVPNGSSDAAPQVRLGDPGTYSGTLSVSNNLGTDTFSFALTVVSHQAPSVNLAADPNGGDVPLTTTLTATASDPDGSIVAYDWDLDGDSTFEDSTGTVPTNTATFTTGGEHTVRVRVTDDDGLTATASAEVTIAAQPSAVINANQTSVVVPDFVSLDATGSSSPNGAITKYEWDWNCDGTIDADTMTDPHYRAPFDALPGT
nr:PKD domain-containing protein [bacterium]